MEPIEQGVPAYRIINTCDEERYRITKIIFTDPRRPALLMRVKFEPRRGGLENYRLHLLAAPHIANQGMGNDGWVGDYLGLPLIYAQRAHVSFALGCSAGWKKRSCGFVGTSDGWTQVRAHGELRHEYAGAHDGNLALTGEIDLPACGGEFVVVVGFGGSPMEAGHVARAALLADPDETQGDFVRGCHCYQETCLPLTDSTPMREAFDVYRVSTAVLRCHEDKFFHGGIIASLSIPWGEVRGDQDIGGYHLVWPRDLVHGAMGLLAAGRKEDAQQTLFYLMCVQCPDGNWMQNMWLDGSAHWTANQIDQTASVLLLLGALRRHADCGPVDPWPGARRAAEFILRTGPVTEQDRWEENEGYTPYTLATAIAALLVAAEIADERGDGDLARRCRETADTWNENIERWLYVTDTPLSREVGVEGY